MAVVLDLYQCTLCFQIFNNCLSCLITIHAGILRICVHDLCIIGHHVDDFQIVPQTHFKVVRVVCRCDLYHAGSEVHFHIIVCHNRDLTVYQRQDQCLSHQIFVAFIVGVDCYGSIAQQGFRTGGRQFQIAAAVLQRIPQMPEMPCLHFIFYFCIGNGSQTLRAPVDDTFAAVDQTFLVVLDKHFLDATVRKQYLLQLFGPCIELVIIVAIHLDAIRTCALTNIITETLILQAIYIPATTS